MSSLVILPAALCWWAKKIIIIIIVRLFLTRRNTTKTLQGRAWARAADISQQLPALSTGY